MLSQTLGGSSASQETCSAFQLPSQFSSYQDYCRYLSALPDEQIDDIFSKGTGPTTAQEPFPLKVRFRDLYSSVFSQTGRTDKGARVRYCRDVSLVVSSAKGHTGPV
jgi:hypothetical protein